MISCKSCLYIQKNVLRIIKLVIIVFSSYSCTSVKTITYFQSKNAIDTAKHSTLSTIIPTAFKIQPDDILAVVVSSLSDETNALFNFPNTNSVTTASYPGSSGGNGIQPLGYLVDPLGEVNLPLIGRVKIAGMTLKDASAHLKEKLDKIIKDPTVNVRFLNNKFTVIGEVSRPGVYNLPNDHVSLPEMIGIAGDLTVYGRRENVMLIRTIDGKREMIKLDLTSREILNSPYYYIQNNDILYVEPREARITSTDRSIQLLPIYLGITSTILLLVNILTK